MKDIVRLGQNPEEDHHQTPCSRRMRKATTVEGMQVVRQKYTRKNVKGKQTVNTPTFPTRISEMGWRVPGGLSNELTD